MKQHTHYCSGGVSKEILEAKRKLDSVDSRTFRNARDRANPFEGIKKEFFGVSRAALKMAELDAECGFMFTAAADSAGDDKLLNFADICAGPGGFTEYILWKKKWLAKGFGFTLIGKLDFKLHQFNRESPWDTFFP